MKAASFQHFHRALRAVISLWCVASVWPTDIARACTIAMPLPTLADHAGQVFVGTVTGMRSYWTEDTPRTIVTEVVFDSVTYWKGSHAFSGDEFRLIVPGGSVDGMELRLCCGPQFTVGKRWVLFVLPEYRTHPIVGIDQGAFRVEVDAEGVEYIATAGGTPLTGVSDAGLPISTNRTPLRAPRDISPGMRLLPPGPEAVGPLSLAEFEARLAPILAASRDHGLTESAGRRVGVTYRGVPFEGRGVQRDLSDRMRGPLEAVQEVNGGAVRAERAEGGR